MINLSAKDILTRGDKIFFTRKDGTKSERTIQELVGKGASCICYSALDGNGNIGRLKEFYPADCAFLSRDENLALNPGAFGNLYETRAAEFLEGFRMLEEARNLPEGAALNNFLPPTSEVLCGDAGGLYLWTVHDRTGETLSRVLEKTPLPKRSLRRVLTLVGHLAEFLHVVHSLGFVHLDVKPSNILYVNPEHVTVFDSDTVFDLRSAKPCRVRGSDGFAAPELAFGMVSNGCDIYSLGCILFTTLVGRSYVADDYKLLSAFVERSPLCAKMSIKERRRLTSVLQQCLAVQPRHRYRNAVQISDAVGELLQTSADENERGDPKIAVRGLLWRETLPLSANTQVAVLGAGTVGQAFIDHVLQIAQVPEVKMHIRAYSLDAEGDKADYLSPRPMARDYLDINGSPARIESLGRVDFLSVPTLDGLPFTKENATVNRLIAEKIAADFDKPNFVFIALGDDALNNSVAEALRKVTNCPVAVIGHDKNVEPELMRQARNVHLSWRDSLCGNDMKTVREELSDPYNLDSSLNYAVSIKYKIQALGVDFDPYDSKVAKAVKRRLESLTDALKAKFIKAEHDRWILEKLVGWSPMLRGGQVDYEACIESLRSTGKIQDAQRLKHQCLIPYDALDDMSRGLHEALVARATRIKNSMALRRSLETLRDKLKEQNPKLLFAVTQILGGNKAYCRNVKTHMKALQAAAVFEREEFEALQRDFFVVAEAAMNRDYRAYDAVLVEQMPFILTWEFPRTAMAFDLNAGFGNAASAVVLNPVELTYLFVFDARSKSNLFAESVRRVVNFLREKSQAEINFVVADMVGNFDATILDGLAVKVRRVATVTQAADFFVEELKARGNVVFDGSNALLSDNFEQAQFVAKIVVVANLPYFEFDYPTKTFRHMQGCEHFAYLRDNASVSVNDLIALTNTNAAVGETESAASVVYEPLWQLMRENPTAVLQCIRELETYDERNDFAATLLAARSDAESMDFLLPQASEQVAEKFLRGLKDAGALLHFEITAVGNGMISLNLVTDAKNQAVFEKIFYSNRLQDSEPIIRRHANSVGVIFRAATVNEVPVSAETISVLKILSKAQLRLIGNLKVTNRIENQVVAFRYASPALRNFLANLRRVLRAFLYSELLRAGTFNDMACDVTFDRFGTSNKFDLVIIREFAVIVVRILPEEAQATDLYEFAGQSNEVLRTAEKVLVVTAVPDENFKALARTLKVCVICPSELPHAAEKLVNLIKE